MAHPLILYLLSICLVLFFPLSLSAPFGLEGTTALSKRDESAVASDLDKLWRQVPDNHKARGNSALRFVIDRTIPDSWGLVYLYGCTGIIISDPGFVIVAHMLQEGSDDGKNCISLENKDLVQKFIDKKLEDETVLNDPGDNTRVDFFWAPSGIAKPIGIQIFKDFFKNWGLKSDDYFRDRTYTRSSGDGEGNPGTPFGKAVAQWIPKVPAEGEQADGSGNLKVFFNKEDPIRNDQFGPANPNSAYRAPIPPDGP